MSVSQAVIDHYKDLPTLGEMTRREIAGWMGVSYESGWFRSILFKLENLELVEKKLCFDFKKGRRYYLYKKKEKALDYCSFYLTGYGKKSRK